MISTPSSHVRVHSGELPLPQHSESRRDSGLVQSAKNKKRIRGGKCGRAAAPPKYRPAHGPFCCALTFSDGTTQFASSAGRNQGATHAQANRLCSRVFPLHLCAYRRSSAKARGTELCP